MTRFNRETMRVLETNPNVANVTPTRITYTPTFRRRAAGLLDKGYSPVDIFREAGLGPEIIGYKRIERCTARWRGAPPAKRMKRLSPAYDPARGAAVRLEFDLKRARMGVSRVEALDQAMLMWLESHDRTGEGTPMQCDETPDADDAPTETEARAC